MDLLKKFYSKEKKTAVLIDPDKTSIKKAKEIVESCYNSGFSFVFVGGSFISAPFDNFLISLKEISKLPIILFPGNPLQISKHADAVLFLSLISGRNPEFLIGNQVIAAPIIKNFKLTTIPTGYILISSNTISSTEYISNTSPIPSNKTDIIKATAVAGEMLGLKLIYLENGSGANSIISCKIISEVKKSLNIPLIVGGGINNLKKLKQVFNAGADIAVIGTAIENNIHKISEFSKF